MMKRIFAAILAVSLMLICGTSTVAASLQPAELVDEGDFQTFDVDPEYMEWLYGMPEDLRSGTTLELLDYFLQSPFIGQQLYSCSSTPDNDKIKREFTVHEAFRELISREDCLDELENYAQRVYNKSASTELRKIELILKQNSVRSLVSASARSSLDYPCLQAIDTSLSAKEVMSGSYVGYVNNIRYYSSGTITTANGLRVEVYTPERELTSSEISTFNEKFNYPANVRLSGPTARYNCHSYAWYSYSTSNPYWIMSISQFLSDGSCVQVSSPQPKDIIVYCDVNGNPIHSGVVYSVNSEDITICSKWGQAGVYRHSIGNVPPDYNTYFGSGKISYALFRYHDYSYQYTGNNYHSGSSHYYQYADICKICSHGTNYKWEVRPCSGPPCASPWSLTPVSEAS